MNAGGVQWRKGYGSPSPGRRTPEQVPSAPPAPPQQLPSIVEEGECTAREGRERVGRVKSRRREDGRLGQRVRPWQHDGGVSRGATRNARGTSGRTWSRVRGGAESNPPTPSVSPGRVDFDGINDSSSRNSDDSRCSSNSSNSNDNGDLPALVGRPAGDLEVFGKLPALQSGCTRSQSWDLTMSASNADALLVCAMRAVEAKKTMEEKAAEIKRARDSLLEERL